MRPKRYGVLWKQGTLMNEFKHMLNALANAAAILVIAYIVTKSSKRGTSHMVHLIACPMASLPKCTRKPKLE